MNLVRAFRFRVQLRKSAEGESGRAANGTGGAGAPLGDGAFQECSGLEVSMDVQEFNEGGRNDGVIRQVGRAKYAELVLKRGMFLGAGASLGASFSASASASASVSASASGSVSASGFAGASAGASASIGGSIGGNGGATVNRELWQWLQGVVAGERPVVRYDGRIEVLSPAGDQVVASWTFDRGLPTKIVGPQLDAQRGEIAIETLHIAHEGLRLGEV